MGEGLYRPSEISLPKKVKEALAGVLRIRPKIRFQLYLFKTPEEAAAARSSHREKSFLTEGGVLWPVVIDIESLRRLCKDPCASLQPGFYELCQAFSEFKGQSFPATLLTRPLAGSATGFVVGRKEGFLVATCYHVARESIERHSAYPGGLCAGAGGGLGSSGLDQLGREPPARELSGGPAGLLGGERLERRLEAREGLGHLIDPR